MAAKKKNKKRPTPRAPAPSAAPRPRAKSTPRASHAPQPAHAPKRRRRSKKRHPSALARCRGPNGTMAQAQAQNPEAENPEPSELWGRAVRSVLFGGAAAAAGVLGTMLIRKANIQSPLANAAVTAVGGSLLGGAVGMANPIAGTLIAHNYMIAATRAAFPAEHVGPIAERAPRAALAPATRDKAHPPARLQGADEIGDYTRLQGVVADTMGDADELGGYAPIEGVIADTMGDADSLGEEEMGDSGLFD